MISSLTWIGVEPNFLQLGQSVRTDHLACLCAEAHWFLHLFPELSMETQGNWEVGLMNDIWSILWHIYMFTSHGDNLLPSPVQSDWDLIMGFLPLRQKIPCRVFVSWQQVNINIRKTNGRLSAYLDTCVKYIFFLMSDKHSGLNSKTGERRKNFVNFFLSWKGWQAQLVGEAGEKMMGFGFPTAVTEKLEHLKNWRFFFKISDRQAKEWWAFVSQEQWQIN